MSGQWLPAMAAMTSRCGALFCTTLGHAHLTPTLLLHAPRSGCLLRGRGLRLTFLQAASERNMPWLGHWTFTGGARHSTGDR